MRQFQPDSPDDCIDVILNWSSSHFWTFCCERTYRVSQKKLWIVNHLPPGDDNNTQQKYCTSGPVFVSICDKLHPFLAISPWKTSIYKSVLPSKENIFCCPTYGHGTFQGIHEELLGNCSNENFLTVWITLLYFSKFAPPARMHLWARAFISKRDFPFWHIYWYFKQQSERILSPLTTQIM